MMRRSPAVQFALIGALLFAVTRWLGTGDGSSAPGSAALEALRGRVPAGDQPAARGDAVPDDEALLQAALARGLERDDPVVQARVVRNMRFLSDEPLDGTALYREALQLGLPRSDLVVRRRLIERMRLLLQEPAFDAEPTEADLQGYLDLHAARFATPVRVRLSHVFLSRARRGAALDADAGALLARLRPEDVTRAAALSDPLPSPLHLAAASQQDLARLFGEAFAAAALALEPHRWHGPVESPYGLHLVWVHERMTATTPPLDAVRAAVRAAVLEERAAAALQAGLQALRTTSGSGGPGQ